MKVVGFGDFLIHFSLSPYLNFHKLYHSLPPKSNCPFHIFTRNKSILSQQNSQKIVKKLIDFDTPL